MWLPFEISTFYKSKTNGFSPKLVKKVITTFRNKSKLK